MLPARAQDLERLAVERVREAHRIVAVGEIDHVLGDMDAVWVGEGADAPAAQVGALPLEDQHRRVFSLKHVHAIC